MQTNNVDFMFVDLKDNPGWGVEIKSGRFAGITYTYGKTEIKFGKDDNPDTKTQYKIDFAWDMIKNPNNIPKTDTELQQVVGNILAQLVLEMAKDKVRTKNKHE